MTNDSVQLIEPDFRWKDEFLAFCRECESVIEENMRWRFIEDMADFDAYIRKRIDNKAGRNLPEGWVPWSEFWLVKRDKVLGTSTLRHQLTPVLEEYGGHIGYVIRPSERRKGYGKEIMRLTLQQAVRMQLSQVLVTCDDVNTASARIIEVNGGRLKDIIWNEEGKRFTRRYWVHLNHNPHNNLLNRTC
jgi:predicted acetyltransferase